MGVAIYGISYDPPEVNRAWSELMGFEFPLLSDPDHVAGRALDAERQPDDRGYGTPKRITYLIDPDGIIRRSYRPRLIDYVSHARAVIADLKTELGH